jgi:type I restriction enzyme M protein
MRRCLFSSRRNCRRRRVHNTGEGVIAIILPHGVLFRGGVEDRIRTKKPDDVLFINAAEHFVKGKRQNVLTEEHIAKIIETYQKRPAKPIERYARRVKMKEIVANDYNLNISRYVSTAQQEEEIDLAATHQKLVGIEESIRKATARHNEFLKELGLPLLPSPDIDSSIR